MEMPVISYFDMAQAAFGWLAISVGAVSGFIGASLAVIAALRTFSRFLSFR